MQEATDGRFRARAGTLTLLSATVLVERDVLLAMLAAAGAGGMLQPIDPGEWAAQREEAELEFEEDEDYEDEEDEEDEEDDYEYEYEDLDLGGEGADPDLDAPSSEAKMVLSPIGEVLLDISSRLMRWLSNCPQGPLELGSAEASEALLALIFSWSAKVVQALAAAPLTLAELSEMIELPDPETLGEHVEALVRTGQLEARPGPDGTTRYAVTEWLREAIASVAAAARHECHRPDDDVLPPDWLDVEAAFQLALPW